MAVSDVDLVPTDAMARAAEKGLRLREEYGRGGTEVGVARARDLINKKSLSPRTVKRMHSYFSRHAVDKKGKGWGKDSAGYIAWLLWGGDPGESWAARKTKEIDKASGSTSEHARFGVSKIDTCPLSVNRYDPDMINMSRTYELLGFAAKPAVFAIAKDSDSNWKKLIADINKRVRAVGGYNSDPYIEDGSATMRWIFTRGTIGVDIDDEYGEILCHVYRAEKFFRLKAMDTDLKNVKVFESRYTDAASTMATISKAVSYVNKFKSRNETKGKK